MRSISEAVIKSFSQITKLRELKLTLIMLTPTTEDAFLNLTCKVALAMLLGKQSHFKTRHWYILQQYNVVDLLHIDTYYNSIIWLNCCRLFCCKSTRSFFYSKSQSILNGCKSAFTNSPNIVQQTKRFFYIGCVCIRQRDHVHYFKSDSSDRSSESGTAYLSGICVLFFFTLVNSMHCLDHLFL